MLSSRRTDPPSLRVGLAAALSLLLAGTALLLGAPEPKSLSVYSSLANYYVPVVQQNGQDYVGLIELLDPLGGVSARPDHRHWKLKYENTELEFEEGKTRVHKHGSDFDLTAPFVVENGRGFIPTASLLSFLPRVLGGPVTFHETARRLFIGDVGIHFTAEVSKGFPQNLVFNFTAPVNPTFATEAGKVRMVFSREPLLAPGSPQLTFDSPVIRSATFQESNGSAELDVSSTVPLLANVSNGGKTITLSAAPAAQPGQTVPLNSAFPTAAPSSGPRHYFAVVDPSHGGSESGALLADTLLEKDITLAIARRLRQEMEARGIATLLLRDGDGTLTLDQRASSANAAHPAIYISVHAATLGTGVRIYTAMLPPVGENRGPFADWNTAQASFIAAARVFASAVQSQIQTKQVPARVWEAPLRPLNNITAAAIGLEVAPPGDEASQLASVPYQELIAAQVAQAVANVKSRMEAAR